MRKWVAAAVALAALVLTAGEVYVGGRDEIAVRNQAVTTQWNLLNMVLQRRADLVPALLDAVQPVTARNPVLASDVARERSGFRSATTPVAGIAANAQLEAAIDRLLAAAAAYPALQANETFLRLQDELAGIKDRIAAQSRIYNQALQDYNAYRSRFPDRIFAEWAGFKPNSAFFSEPQTSLP